MVNFKLFQWWIQPNIFKEEGILIVWNIFQKIAREERTLPFLFYMASIMLISEPNKDSHTHTRRKTVRIYHERKYKCPQQTTSKASPRIHDNHVKFIQGVHGCLSIEKKKRSLGVYLGNRVLTNSMWKALGFHLQYHKERNHSKILLKNSKN